jgi:hypothetical protein
MMIKLTEVVTSTGHYNPGVGKMDVTYKLRSFYVNPKFVVSMSDNEKLNKVHEHTPIIDKLLAEAKFTKLVVAGVPGTVFYDILGAPEQLLKNF